MAARSSSRTPSFAGVELASRPTRPDGFQPVTESRSTSSPQSRHVRFSDDAGQDPEQVTTHRPGDPEDLEQVTTHRPGGPEESSLSIALQIFFPLILAGLGMVAAGLVLDAVVTWDVFLDVPEIFILVPALLGLKGNLEMTLASRLSTHASLGTFENFVEASSLVVGNLALVQCQGIAVGFLASCVAAAMSFLTGDAVSLDDLILLCCSAILTASIASLILAIIMVAVVVAAFRAGYNPDNVAAPIAASLGDITTLTMLSWTAEALYQLHGTLLEQSLVLAYCFGIAPICAVLAYRNDYTKQVLQQGWTPVLSSMLISSAGGLILDHAVSRYPGMAAFQPVMNGAGGNLVAVQASRICTHLHSRGEPGNLPEDKDSERRACSVFFGPSVHTRSARVLLGLVVPGHLIFFAAIQSTEPDMQTASLPFLLFYLGAAIVQEIILLYACLHLVHWQWIAGIDPDSAAVPYLTALGDVFGTALLVGVFTCLFSASDIKVGTAMVNPDDFVENITNATLVQSFTP